MLQLMNVVIMHDVFFSFEMTHVKWIYETWK